MPAALLLGFVISLAAVIPAVVIGVLLVPDFPPDAARGINAEGALDVVVAPVSLVLALVVGIPSTLVSWRRGWVGPARMALVWIGATIIAVWAFTGILEMTGGQPLEFSAAVLGLWSLRIGVVYGGMAGVILWRRLALQVARSRPGTAGSPPGRKPLFWMVGIALILTTAYWLFLWIAYCAAAACD